MSYEGLVMEGDLVLPRLVAGQSPLQEIQKAYKKPSSKKGLNRPKPVLREIDQSVGIKH